MKIATLLFAATILVSTATLFSQEHDVPAEVNSARSHLKEASDDLSHAGGDWGGHRSKALQHIQAAQSELNEAEKWAREHHDMK